MIHEALKQEHILPALKDGIESGLSQMLDRAGLPGDLLPLLKESLDHPRNGGDGAAYPHLFLPSIESPVIVLGLFPDGAAGPRGKVYALAMLLSPEQESVRHLQMLERLAALLPPIARNISRLKSPERIARLLSDAEQKQAGPTFINVTEDDLAFELKTNLAQGLTDEEAERRLALHGPNQLKRARKIRWYTRLLKSFFSFFAVLLWGAGLLCFVPGVDMPQLGIAILLVVAVNGIFSFFQEQKSDNAVDALQSLLSHKCRVLRGAQVKEIDVAGLVPGDVIVLEEGDHVPADARLIEAFQVEVDNSSLTGESTSARRYKSDRPVLVDRRFLWIEMPNILFAGSSLLKGQAKAVVFGTGMRTEIGRIADLTQAIPAEQSPLQKELKSTVFTISILAACLAVTFSCLAGLRPGSRSFKRLYSALASLLQMFRRDCSPRSRCLLRWVLRAWQSAVRL